MSLILSLETASTSCSAALHNEGKILGVAEIHEEHSHAARLAVLAKQVTEEAGVAFTDLSAVAISSGPGSYTGLRIGTSTAKGICYATGAKLLAIDSLTLMAWKVVSQKFQEYLFCPMLDARRMEVYCAVYDDELKMKEPISAKVLDKESFADLLDQHPMLFFGNGSVKAKDVIVHPNAFFLDGIYPSASALGELAFQRFAQGKFEDMVHFEPLYLKEFLIKKPVITGDTVNK